MNNAKSHPKKTDNKNIATKLEIRRRIIKKIAPPYSVIDACAGDQKIWSILRWEIGVERYLPIDIGGRHNSLKINSAEFFQKYPIPEGVNIIDIDTYGEPWEIYIKAIQNIQTRNPVGFFLTRGLVRAGGGNLSNFIKNTNGIPEDWNIPSKEKIISALDEVCLTYPINFGYMIKNLITSRPDGGHVTYYGFIVQIMK